MLSEKSRRKLDECHLDLKIIFSRVSEVMGCEVLAGFRGEEIQNEAFRTGKSKQKWPTSKHNTLPSKAIDIVPYPVDWNDSSKFYYMAGVAKGIAHDLGIKLRWGGDWDMDTDFKDQKFNDLSHFELL